MKIAPRPIYQFQHTSGYSHSIVGPRFVHSAVMQWRHRAFWRDFIRERQAAIVHLDAVTLAPMGWSARQAGAKVVCLVQETVVGGLVDFRTWLLRQILSRWTDTTIFISDYDRRTWRCHAPRIEVVPNWVDFKVFDKAVSGPASRRVLGLPADAKILLFMGGVEPIKGLLPLLRALTLLRDLDDLLLVIAGYGFAPARRNATFLRRALATARRYRGGDYPKRVADFIAENGLSERVRFVGMREDVVPLYAAANLVAFPATCAHQARPVLEAGAMGKPVVVSDFENLREFVEDGRTALTVPPNDAPALARAIRQLLNDPALAARLGEGNFKMALAKHDGETNARKIVAAYEHLARQTRTGGVSRCERGA